MNTSINLVNDPLLKCTKELQVSVKLFTNVYTALTMVMKANAQMTFSSGRKNLTEQKSCEGLLTKTECLNALNNMECNKTPGSDGLPAEFYKVF